MKTTTDQLRRAYALARLRGKLRPLGARWATTAEDPNSLPLNMIPRRSSVREAKRASKAMRREFQPESMLNMGQPAHHRPSPRWPDENTKNKMAAHEARRAAGWIHG